MDKRPIVNSKMAKRFAKMGYVKDRDYLVSDHCIAAWGARWCIICGRFIKRHDQRCR